VVGVLAERQADLRRKHHVLAPSTGERLADDLLRLPAAVDVGGVDEVEQVLDMFIAIATINSDADYLEPILQTVLDGLRPRPPELTRG
jgi:hypothetical protein